MHLGAAFKTACIVMAVWGATFVDSGFPLRAQQIDPGAGGAEVLARGPVHEAFAAPVVFDPQPGLVVQRKPPDPIEEMPPEQKPEGETVWIPGYWSWDEERDDFIWVSGFWRLVPPGRQWVPGYWAQVEGGYQWTSGFWAPADAQELEYLPAPPETLENGPPYEATSTDQLWAPGCWYWVQSRYVWRPGFWMTAQPGWVWCPAHYVRARGGFIFVDGYWDYAPLNRGLLFAPVYFRHTRFIRPGFFFTPTVFVDVNVIVNHLFVRPRHHHYYFGDYYASNYFQAGIYPWFAFHKRDFGYDPIYVYHRHRHRGDRDWDERIRQEYRHRRDREEARPAHTFTALQAQHRDDTRGDTLLVKSLSQTTALARPPVRLERADKGFRERMALNAKATRQFTEQRVEREAKVVAQAGKLAKGRPAQVELPKSPVVDRPSVDRPGAKQPADRKTPITSKPPIVPKTPAPDPGAKQKPLGKPRPMPDDSDVQPKTLPKRGKPTTPPKGFEPQGVPKTTEPKGAPKTLQPKAIPKTIEPKGIPQPRKVEPKPPATLPKKFEPKLQPFPRPQPKKEAGAPKVPKAPPRLAPLDPGRPKGPGQAKESPKKSADQPRPGKPPARGEGGKPRGSKKDKD
jgi:hypothetical protein